MTEPYAEALRASYDAVLDELESAADISRGLADLRAHLYEQQLGADTGRLGDVQARTGERHTVLADRTAGNADIRFLTVAEVALIMRVSKMTVYRLVHTGELEAIKVGRSFRIPEQAVTRHLAESVKHGQYRE
jgi:excisionase family DNA binding protein